MICPACHPTNLQNVDMLSATVAKKKRKGGIFLRSVRRWRIPFGFGLGRLGTSVPTRVGRAVPSPPLSRRAFVRIRERGSPFSRDLDYDFVETCSVGRGNIEQRHRVAATHDVGLAGDRVPASFEEIGAMEQGVLPDRG